MPLSWSEIRSRALGFSREWKDERREAAESQTFWNEFFEVFGIRRRRLATFQAPVRLLRDRRGQIDLFWKGTLLVEHKTAGQDLDAAYAQAADYFEGIPDDDLPKFVLVSDFQRFRLYDLENGARHDFGINQLHDHIHLFDFMLGYTRPHYSEELPVNVRAAELMAKLHDRLSERGYAGHDLGVFLVRLMFCMFADDTGIFSPKDHFRHLIETTTKPNGSDLSDRLTKIFQILDTPVGSRPQDLDEDLKDLPYVNGKLFTETLRQPFFDEGGRELLLECCAYDWSKVSPAVFGSMFQTVMDHGARRDVGAHYTSEQSILKTLGPLFLDELKSRAARAHGNLAACQQVLRDVLATVVLDPACGCGNFLIVAYRELRILEIELHQEIQRLTPEGERQTTLGAEFLRGLNVNSMFGIEIAEFPARIAETALWLVDHQLNIHASELFGELVTRLPLVTSPTIVVGNAIQIPWEQVVSKNRLTAIVGNPPYVGKKRRTTEQANDLKLVCGSTKGFGELDYVACWFHKAAKFIKGTNIRVGFVATNSITQGEQVGLLWPSLLRAGVRINFAHRTFRWLNDARGMAHVFVVVIGFSMRDAPTKTIFDYVTPDSVPRAIQVSRINPYLVDGPDVLLGKRSEPVSPNAPPIAFGSMPNDAGNLLLDDDAKAALLLSSPRAEAFVRRFFSAVEFLHSQNRWCLWLQGVSPEAIAGCPDVLERVTQVRAYRLRSTRTTTQALALKPTLFGEIRQPEESYIVVPRHSSELRPVIPMAIAGPDTIVGDSCAWVGSSDLYHLGVLQSSMHMAWVRQVCGRIKSDFRYSNRVVYNNFPWPPSPSNEGMEAVRAAMAEVQRVRASFPDVSLADLYTFTMMPPPLVDAHRALDRSVDRCYRSATFPNEATRLAYLFELYAGLTGAKPIEPLPVKPLPPRRRPIRSSKATRKTRYPAPRKGARPTKARR